MPRSIRPILTCPHGLRPFHDPDCPECRQQQSDEWRAKQRAIEAAVNLEGDTAEHDTLAGVASDPEPKTEVQSA